MGALPPHTVGAHRSPVPARRAPINHLTDTTQEACGPCGDPSAAHGHSSPWCAAQCSPQHSNNPVSAFILAMTVALLQPTNPLFDPTASGTHLPERPCNGQHNTGWPLCDMCASQHPQSSCIDEKKSKNCAHKHISAPDRRGTLGPSAPCGANRFAWPKDHTELHLAFPPQAKSPQHLMIRL